MGTYRITTDGGVYEVTTEDQPMSNPVADFASGAASKMNPVGMLRGMADMLEAAVSDPAGAAKRFGAEVLAHPYSAFSRGVEAARAGNAAEAMAHFASALDPAGFVTEESRVKASTPGKVAEGLGELAGTGVAALLGEKLPGLGAAAKDKAVSIFSNPNVQKAATKLPGVKTAVAVKDFAGAVKQAAAVPGPPSLPSGPTPLRPPLATPQAISETIAPELVNAETVPVVQRPAGTPLRPPLATKPVPDAATMTPAEYLKAKQEAGAAPKVVEIPKATESNPLPPRDDLGRFTTQENLDKSMEAMWQKAEDKGLIPPRKPGEHLGDSPKGKTPRRFDEGGPSPVMRSSKGKTRSAVMLEPSQEMQLKLLKPGAAEAALNLLNELNRGRK